MLIHPTDHPSAPCPFCKGNTGEIDLEEAMTRSVLRQDEEVKWVEENLALKEKEGAGASLRFR